MDRPLSDRLPTHRLPGLGNDHETDSERTQHDGDTLAEPDADDPLDVDLDMPDEKPPLRVRLRKVLLGVSLGGLGLAVLAALLRRVLGGDEDETAEDAEPESDEELTAELATDEGAEPDTETDEEDVESVSDLLTADAEGAAAMVGLGFNLLVRALVDDDEADA